MVDLVVPVHGGQVGGGGSAVRPGHAGVCGLRSHLVLEAVVNQCLVDQFGVVLELEEVLAVLHVVRLGDLVQDAEAELLPVAQDGQVVGLRVACPAVPVILRVVFDFRWCLVGVGIVDESFVV